MAAKHKSTAVSRPHSIIRRWSLGYRRIRHRPLIERAFDGGKWFLLVFLVLIPSIIVAGFLIKRTHTSYKFFTGPKGSTYAELGLPIAAALNKPDRIEELLHLNIVPDFIPEESCGPTDNIDAIDRADARLGFAEDGLPLYFEPTPGCRQGSHPAGGPHHVPRAEIRVRALMPLFLSPLHVVARKTTAYGDIRNIPPHTKVYLGPQGSASALIAQSILLHYGISVDQPVRHLDGPHAIQQLIEKQVDVVFFLDRLHEEKLHRLLERDDVKLLTIEHAQGLNLLYPYLQVLTIPAETYKASATDIITVGSKTLLVTSTELNEIEVFKIVEKLSHHINEIIKDIPYNATRVTDSDPQKELFYPLHDGAIRFYTHDPPLFMDSKALAAIGTYFWALYAAYGFTGKYLREYRAHRFIYAVDRAARAFSQLGERPRVKRYEHYTRKLRSMALSLLRRRKIQFDDYKHIDEYITANL